MYWRFGYSLRTTEIRVSIIVGEKREATVQVIYINLEAYE